MKKIYSVSIIIICSLFLFPISKVLAKGDITPIYVNFVINNGLSITGDKEDGVRLNVRSDSFILIGASSLSETAFCDQLNCAESYLSYTNAPNYQNAQCTVDGVLKVSGETLKLSTTPSSPTQIICTAEPIPEPGPDFLSYESQAGIGFIVNETINLSISGDITIPELMPGNSVESNTVDIKVSTNTDYGYSLSAKMGTASADLIAANSSSTDPKFTGLSTSASESTLADNTWGYKTKTSDGSWSNYSGLPISTDTEKILVERSSQPTGGEEVTQFKIGAHASTSMPANTYSNTIIFHAVAKQPPTHTITWNANGGTVSPTTSSIQYGKPIGTLPTPTYEGYNFLGWFTQAEDGEEITAETTVTANAIYYAHWEEAGPKLINFTISGDSHLPSSFQAEEGMTWQEWMLSDYAGVSKKIDGICVATELFYPYTKSLPYSPWPDKIFIESNLDGTCFASGRNYPHGSDIRARAVITLNDDLSSAVSLDDIIQANYTYATVSGLYD